MFLIPHSALRTPHWSSTVPRKGSCWGTYLHGIFDNNEFRLCVLNGIRERKGLAPMAGTVDYDGMKDKAIDNLADLVRKHLDMEQIMRSMEL